MAIWINAAYENLELCDLSNLVCPTIDYVSIPKISLFRIYFKCYYNFYEDSLIHITFYSLIPNYYRCNCFYLFVGANLSLCKKFSTSYSGVIFIPLDSIYGLKN